MGADFGRVSVGCWSSVLKRKTHVMVVGPLASDGHVTVAASKNRAAAVVEFIQRGIRERKFKVGQALPPERELATRLKVSRTSLREGISLLVSKGVLVRQHGTGTYVRSANDQRMAEIWADMVDRHPLIQADLIEFREMLESRTAELAAERGTQADRERLVQLGREVDAAYSGDDHQQQVKADVALHQAIAEATHNPVFFYLIESLLKVLHEHVQLSIAGLSPQSDTSRQLRAQHREIVSAIVAGDVARAGAASRQHIEFVRTRLNALDRMPQRRKR
jgi:GntR family transcriptional repressor for pyruvate dehydrogenase complex